MRQPIKDLEPLLGEVEYQSFEPSEEQYLSIDYDEQIDYGGCEVAKPKGPPILKEYEPDKDKSELEGRLDKDFAWALAAASENQEGIRGQELLGLDQIEDEEVTNDFVGSWTAFNKEVTSVKTTKSRNEYLPTIPHPPDDSICKYYLDYIIDLADSLHLEHIFVHCDQAVFYKMSQIIRVARCPKWSAAKIATVGGQIRPIKQNANKQPNFGQLCPVRL